MFFWIKDIRGPMSVTVYCRTSGESAMLSSPVPALYGVVRARRVQEGYSKPKFHDVLGIEDLLIEQA
jgi:hypothetical protein